MNDQTNPDRTDHKDAEQSGTDQRQQGPEDQLVDEWGDESFPASDPPGAL